MPLPIYDLGVPGPQRDYLVTQVLSGEKTATSSLLAHWRADNEDLPTPGSRFALTDSSGQRGIVEITEVRLLRLADVTDTIAHAEGEGFQDAGAWRTAHEAFWSQDGDHPPLADDETVVVEFFRMVDDEHDGGDHGDHGAA